MDPNSPYRNTPDPSVPSQTYPPHPGQGQFQSQPQSPPTPTYQPQAGGALDTSQWPQQSTAYPQPVQGHVDNYPENVGGEPQGYQGQPVAQSPQTLPGQQVSGQGWGFNVPHSEPVPVQSTLPGDPTHQLPSMDGQAPPPANVNPQNNYLTPPPLPKRYDKQPKLLRMVEWLRGHWWAPLLVIAGLVLMGDIAYQVILPYDTIPSGVKVDGLEVGGMKKDDAIKAVNKAYADAKVDIFFGSASVPQQTTTVSTLGISVNNKERMEGLTYPVWLRFVPTSSFWVSATQKVPPVVYSYDTVKLDEYTLRELGHDCRIESKDATIILDDGIFKSVASEPGGNCDINEFKSQVRSATLDKGELQIKVGMNEQQADLSEDSVVDLVEQLNRTLGANIPISAGSVNHEIPSGEAKSWLSFRTVKPESESEDEPDPEPYIAYDVDGQYIQDFVDGSKLAEAVQKPGVTKVSTHNYNETGRETGASGTAINLDAAVAGFRDVADGKTANVVVPIGAVGPTVEYSRSYDPTPEGFKALVEHFTTDNEGKIGIVIADIGGREPHINIAVNDRVKVPAGGVEGLFLAYTAQIGIDDGTLQSTAKVAGSRDYTQCIDDVLISQDESCLEGLLSTMGNAYVQQKMSEAGLADTDFSGAQNVTSARDIYTLIRNMEENKTPLKSRSALLSIMRKNLTREGLYAVVPGNTSVATSKESGVANQGAVVSSAGKYAVGFASEGAGDLELIEKFIKSYEELRAKRPRR